MQAWRVDRELLAVGVLRLALQRIALAHWRADAPLRSWGVAPLFALDAASVAAPCWPGEALWLGAWGEEGAASATVTLRSADIAGTARMHVPAESAITGLVDAAGAARPLAWPSLGQDRMTLELSVRQATDTVVLQLVLLPPAAWEQCSGRKAPPPRFLPPPLPPRLG